MITVIVLNTSNLDEIDKYFFQNILHKVSKYVFFLVFEIFVHKSVKNAINGAFLSIPYIIIWSHCDYAELVPREEVHVAEYIWYLPHHCVHKPNKPDILRMIVLPNFMDASLLMVVYRVQLL